MKDMSKELKIRLADPQAVVDKLQELGARHTGDVTYEYTYFNQPEDKVLKLTKKGEQTFKTVIEREGDRFIIQSSDKVSDPEEEVKKLTERYGVKRHLVNHRTFYVYEAYELSINNIEDVGTFLIIEGQDPQPDFVTATLGIGTPEIIKDSFDNL